MMAWRFLGVWIIAATVLAGFGLRYAAAQQSVSGKGTVAGLPSDIYPDTLTRIPMAKKEDMNTEEEKQAFDRTAGPNGDQPGPVGANELRRYFPIVADHYRDAIRWIREKGGLEPRFAELAILVATRESNGQYEWSAHEPSALKAGIAPATVDIVRNKKEAKGLPEKEEVVIRFGREMHREPKVSSKTFAYAERLFGRNGTLAIAIIISHYSASSMLLHAYDARWSPDRKPPFPVP